MSPYRKQAPEHKPELRRWPPPPPRPHYDWSTVTGPQRDPLLAWESGVNEWLASGTWWERWRRRRDPWVQAWTETGRVRFGARISP